MRNAKLTVKKLKPYYRGDYIYVGIQVYPELDPRTDKRADATIVFRKARTGLKIYDVKAKGISVLSLAFASISSMNRQTLGADLIKHGSVSRAQVQSFGQIRF